MCLVTTYHKADHILKYGKLNLVKINAFKKKQPVQKGYETQGWRQIVC